MRGAGFYRRSLVRWLAPGAAVLMAACSSGGGKSSGSTDGDAKGTSDIANGTDGSDGTADAGDGADGTDSAADGTDSADGTDGTDGNTGTPIVDLRADTNRDGVVDVTGTTDEVGEDAWTAEAGAVFLANLDDDEKVCKTTGDDVDLPKCNDAADDAVNGPSDLLDMAALEVMPWPTAPDGAKVQVSLSAGAPARLFWQSVPGDSGSWRVVPEAFLPVEALRAGISLRLEGTDIVRSRDKWDGLVTVTLKVLQGSEELGADSVILRVAPVLTFHHLLPAETVYATALSGTDSTDFRGDLATAIDTSSVQNNLVGIKYSDQWAQDFFELGYMSMPAEGGAQHTIRVAYRSANVESNDKQNPLRRAGRYAFDLRGPDFAAIQEYDQNHPGEMDSLNSFGNTETIPPYTLGDTSYPLGRVFRGKVDFFYPDPKFTQMVEDQLVQPPLYVNTSWLLVGHVDETMTFLPTNNARGWTVGANDAPMAKTMLEDLVTGGYGDAQLFVDKKWEDFPKKNAAISITKLLADQAIMGASAKGAAEVDGQLETLLAGTGVAREEVVPFAFLHEELSGYSVAYQPGTVNGLLLDSKTFAPPKPHGPSIEGKDPFEEQVTKALDAVGITTVFVEDWDLYHRLLGEVHCGSNAARQIPEVKWWETGR